MQASLAFYISYSIRLYRDVNAALNLRNYGYNILLTGGLLNTKFFGVILGKASELEKEIL